MTLDIDGLYYRDFTNEQLDATASVLRWHVELAQECEERRTVDLLMLWLSFVEEELQKRQNKAVEVA